MGQLLDRAIRLYRNNFLTFVGIVALTQIPATAVSIFFLFISPQPDLTTVDPSASFTELMFTAAQSSSGIGNPFLYLFVTFLTMVLLQIATAALTKTVAENYLGHSLSLMDAYRKIGRSWITLVLASILAGLASIGLVIWWLLVPCIGWFTGLGMLFYFALVVIPFIAPVVVLEERGAREAIGRAWELARRRIWWLLGFMLLLGLFSQLIVTGPALLSAYVVQSTVGGTFNSETATLAQQVISLLLNMIYLPLQLTCVTLLYFDVRVRTEGFDLALLAASSEDEPVDTQAVLAEVPALTEGGLPTRAELGNFALMTIAGGVLYFGLVILFTIIVLAFSGAAGGF